MERNCQVLCFVKFLVDYFEIIKELPYTVMKSILLVAVFILKSGKTNFYVVFCGMTFQNDEVAFYSKVHLLFQSYYLLVASFAGVTFDFVGIYTFLWFC